MNKIERLKLAFSKHIHIPWRTDISSDERVIFCIYNQEEERNLRLRLEDFAIETRHAGHEWVVFDLTNTFAVWLNGQKYKREYFLNPTKLASLDGYERFLQTEFVEFLSKKQTTANTVIALVGVASLFGFLKVNTLVTSLSSSVDGRLVIFFPGSYENNNYRLLDTYDGWNYLAVPITADME